MGGQSASDEDRARVERTLGPEPAAWQRATTPRRASATVWTPSIEHEYRPRPRLLMGIAARTVRQTPCLEARSRAAPGTRAQIVRRAVRARTGRRGRCASAACTSRIIPPATFWMLRPAVGEEMAGHHPRARPRVADDEDRAVARQLPTRGPRVESGASVAPMARATQRPIRLADVQEVAPAPRRREGGPRPSGESIVGVAASVISPSPGGGSPDAAVARPRPVPPGPGCARCP